MNNSFNDSINILIIENYFKTNINIYLIIILNKFYKTIKAFRTFKLIKIENFYK